MFGDDINSTPLVSLQQLPAMTSKADTGNVPLEPPVYNPNVPVGKEKKRVRFADEQRQRRQPQQRQRYYPSQQQQPLYIQQPEQPQEKKKGRIVELLGVYGQHVVVFALVFAVIWYYSKFAATSYFGNGTGYVSLMGTLFLASLASGVYGVSKQVLA